MSVGLVGAFAYPGAITAQAVSTTLPFAYRRYLYWRQSFQLGGNVRGLPPLQLESYPILVAFIRLTFECQIWKRDEVVAQ